MIDYNIISYSFSIITISIGLIMFLFSNFRMKYLSGFVILSLGSRIGYWLFVEIGNEISLVLKIAMIIFFGLIILSSSIGILLSNDGKAKNDAVHAVSEPGVKK